RGARRRGTRGAPRGRHRAAHAGEPGAHAAEPRARGAAGARVAARESARGRGLRVLGVEKAAILLTTLGPEAAAAVFRHLSQPEAAERIADLQSVPEDLLADVGDVLAGQVQGLARAAPRTGFPGAKLVADILNVADETVEARIFAHLEARAPEVADVIRGLMLNFEDLLRLDDRGMQV